MLIVTIFLSGAYSAKTPDTFTRTRPIIDFKGEMNVFYHYVNAQIQLSLLSTHHAGEMISLIDESRHNLREWLPWIDEMNTIEDSRSFIQATMNQFAANNGFWAGIWHQGSLNGVIGFHQVDWENRSASIGCWIGEKYQGRGVATNACRAMVDVAFYEYDLNRVEIQCAVTNHKSRHIPEKLGFVLEGCRRQAEWLYDHFVDHAIYGMLSKDWAGIEHKC